jgi:membrane dipeptidase
MTLRPNKGFHPPIERNHPFTFIDGCMQAWPDADYATAHRLGVSAFAVTAWWPHAGLEEALEGLMRWHLIARQHPRLSVAQSADDIRRARGANEACFILASQDGEFMGHHLHRLEAFVRLGLRMLIPAYNRTNLLCGGCLDGVEVGLTQLGERVVEEAARLGLLLDLSHVGRCASLEIIERSPQPVVFSHSNMRAIVDHPRCIDDEQVLACTARGGVIGLAPFGPFVLKPEQRDWPDLDDFIDHVDHVADLTGSCSHIAIGTDMSLGSYPLLSPDPWGPPRYPEGSRRYAEVVCGERRSPMRSLRDFNAYSEVGHLIERLLQRGYSDAEVGGILGGNLLRLFDQVWSPPPQP